MEDQRDDLKADGCRRNGRAPDIPIQLMRELPGLIRDSDYKVTLVYDGNSVINVERRYHRPLYGVAIDIGTTTVVCYLIDLKTGRQVDTISGLNAQRPFGGDVISRIQYAMENEDGLARLRRGIVDQISELIRELAYRNNIPLDYIYNVVVAGNTIMGHFFMGVTPQHIVSTPFTPATQGVIYPPMNWA